MRLASAISSSRESDAASFSRGLYLLPSEEGCLRALERGFGEPDEGSIHGSSHPGAAQRRRANATAGG